MQFAKSLDAGLRRQARRPPFLDASLDAPTERTIAVSRVVLATGGFNDNVELRRQLIHADPPRGCDDHLCDVLLDAAAMGVNVVEREGVSISHPARFLLVGTMNPEEGELRPQLLDRFGLTVEVAASREPDQRVEVVRRRLAYDDDPEGFAARWADEESSVRARIVAATAEAARYEAQLRKSQILAPLSGTVTAR